MSRSHWSNRASMLSLLLGGLLSLGLLGMAECGGGEPTPTPTPRPGKLQWYYTCGDPVCSGHTGNPSVPKCTSEEAGDPCQKEGATCDPGDDCNRLLVCAAEDPTQQPGGCPISQAALKKDIRYLSPGELQTMRNELLQMRLATYQYAAAPEGTAPRLGFLIDDVKSGPAVLPNGRQVDVYGYTSMSVAALQVQAQELDSLRQEVAALRHELESARAALPGCKATP